MEFARNTESHLPLRAFAVAFLLTLATSVSAAPGELTDVPLYTRGGAEPNIMFVLDSSGSMQGEIWPPSEYDENATYASCANPLPKSRTYTTKQCNRRGCRDVEVTDYYEVDFQVNTSDGSVQFKMDDGNSGTNDPWRTWDTSSDCFDDDTEYRAWFYAYETDGSYYETGSDPQFGDYRDESTSGKLLNWYFSELNDAGTYVAAKFLDSDGEAARSKVPVTRTDVMKTSAAELVSGLKDVRVGLMQFDGDSGARALAGLASMSDDNTRNSYLSIIDGITADGSTPLAESFTGVGRYFITGYEDNNLTYQAENGTVTDPGKNIFDDSPDWDDVEPDVTKPDSTVAGGAIQYYCQKSFMVALTDGEPTSDDSISDHLKDYDYNCSDNDGGCTGSEMDDVIKALYDMDLRPDLTEPDNTPVKNNITSYIIGFANDGLSNTPVMKNAGKLGGGGVYSASNSSTLKATFNSIINHVNAITGSSSSIAFNTTSLEQGSALYAAKFNSGDWSGDLSAFQIGTDGALAETASWSASTKLGDKSPGSRVMITSKDGTGVAFRSGLIDDSGNDHESDLEINASTGSPVVDELAADRLAYLRGDRTKEGKETTDFRERGGRLGDIVNSTPIYVGVPNASWASADFPEASEYASFKSDKSDRTPAVYVGANDGFLHGFNAGTSDASAGEEIIAYAPEAVLSSQLNSGLHALSSQLYEHNYYVDGTPTVTDVYIDGSWKTVLVGSLGGGGKGYFALDVTNPGSFSEDTPESVFMWEFTDSDNSNLGYSFSRAQIGRMPNGKWAAIFGNGYNSETGDAGLFIVYLDGTGSEYLSTNNGGEDDKNGLSTPAIVDANLDGTVDRVYAGDLKGNLWAFDVSGALSDNWGIAYGNTDIDGDTGVSTTTSQPLISIGEPITGGPLVARNTDYTGGDAPNLLVTFGTGQYLTDSDTSDNSAGGFYAVSDNGTGGLNKGSLVERTIATREVNQLTSEGVEDGTSRVYRTLDGEELVWSQKSGWYIQLDSGNTPTGQDGGERVITRPDLLRSTLFFNTMVPTGQVCSAGGYGWQMSVDVRTGLAPEDRGIFDGNGDGMINRGDQGLVGSMVTGGAPNKPGFINGDTRFTSTTSGDVIPTPIDPGGGEREGRLSWEEVTPP